MTKQIVVIGQSAFADTSVGVGPFRSYDRALRASEDLEAKGYNTEVVELAPLSEIGDVVNDEGADS